MRTVHRAAGPLALAVVLAGCGAGGFGSRAQPPVDQDVRSYVALGDDFTAAPGTGKTVGHDGCQRSDANYPSLLARELGADDLTDVSCAGATTHSVTDADRPARGRPKVPAQLDAVEHGTDLVTLGIGLTDRDLLSNAFRVCTALPCAGKVTPQAVLADQRAMGDAVTAAVRTIQDRAPDAYIVVVGYPTILPDTGSCDALPKMEQLRLDTANVVLDGINDQLRSAARQTGAAYADIAQVSVGHELCSADAWVRGGPDGPDGALELHPTAAEQRAVTDVIAELVKSR